MQPVTAAALAKLDPQPGERIIDIGCGAGETALAIADRVQAHGHVLGIDVSSPLLKVAAARAAVTPEYPIELRNADAASHRFAAASFDALFSRFGVMFFADPAAAFANLAQALKPGGRLVFACWRDRRDNRWVRLPVEAGRKHIAQLPPPPGPDDPGPFAFADEARIVRVLTAAGFAGIDIERFDADLFYGSDAADAARFLTQMGPVASVLNDHPPATRARRRRPGDRNHAGARARLRRRPPRGFHLDRRRAPCLNSRCFVRIREGYTMTIKRIQVGPRMSQAVVHGDKVYLAGLVADDTSQSVAGQTRQILDKIDALLKQAGSGQIQIAQDQYLDVRHGAFRRDEQRVG